MADWDDAAFEAHIVTKGFVPQPHLYTSTHWVIKTTQEGDVPVLKENMNEGTIQRKLIDARKDVRNRKRKRQQQDGEQTQPPPQPRPPQQARRPQQQQQQQPLPQQQQQPLPAVAIPNGGGADLQQQLADANARLEVLEEQLTQSNAQAAQDQELKEMQVSPHAALSALSALTVPSNCPHALTPSSPLSRMCSHSMISR